MASQCVYQSKTGLGCTTKKVIQTPVGEYCMKHLRTAGIRRMVLDAGWSEAQIQTAIDQSKLQLPNAALPRKPPAPKDLVIVPKEKKVQDQKPARLFRTHCASEPEPRNTSEPGNSSTGLDIGGVLDNIIGGGDFDAEVDPTDPEIEMAVAREVGEVDQLSSADMGDAPVENKVYMKFSDILGWGYWGTVYWAESSVEKLKGLSPALQQSPHVMDSLDAAMVDAAERMGLQDIPITPAIALLIGTMGTGAMVYMANGGSLPLPGFGSPEPQKEYVQMPASSSEAVPPAQQDRGVTPRDRGPRMTLADVMAPSAKRELTPEERKKQLAEMLRQPEEVQVLAGMI